MYLGRHRRGRADRGGGRRAAASVHAGVAARRAAARRPDRDAGRLSNAANRLTHTTRRAAATSIPAAPSARWSTRATDLHRGGPSRRRGRAPHRRSVTSHRRRRAALAPAPLREGQVPCRVAIASTSLQHRLDAARAARRPGRLARRPPRRRGHAAASGVLNLATGVEATTDSVFQIGSITKVWTATARHAARRRGARRPRRAGAPVPAELPASPTTASSEAVTIRHLLTHTSGIDGDHFADTGRGDDALERYVASCAELRRSSARRDDVVLQHRLHGARPRASRS